MSDITLTVSAPGPTVDLAVVAGTSVTLIVSSGGGVSDHASLPDLATSGHPASIIAFTPTGSIAATTVQAAVAEVATDAAAAYQPLDADLTAVAALTAPATSISGAAQKASNLSDLASASSDRTNLGLGGAATLSVGTTAGTVAAGDDSRLSNARTPTAHASSHAGAGSDPIAALGPLTITNTGTGSVPLLVQGFLNQVVDLFSVKNSAGTARLRVAYDGGIYIGTSGSSYMEDAASQLRTLTALAASSGSVSLIVKGAASQSANLQDWRDSSAAVLSSVTAAGLHKWSSGNEQTTVGAAGAASALPASPTKYLKVVGSDGTTYVVPAFLAA